MGAAGDPGADQPAPKVTLRTILADAPVRLAMVGVFANVLGFGIIAPVLPLYAHSFGVGYEAVGLLISGFALARLVFDLACGPIVDRLGERLATSGGVAFVGVTAAFTAAAPNFPFAVVARSLGGAGSAVFFAALYSYLLKVVPKDRMGRTLSVFFGTFNVGSIAGAPIGGFIAHVAGLAAPLWVYAGLSLASGVLFFRFIRDPQPAGSQPAAAGTPEPDPPRRPSALRSVAFLVRLPAFPATLGINFASFLLSGAVFNTLVPLFGQRALGMGTVGIGWALTAFIVAEFALLYPAGAASDRWGRKPLLMGSLVGLAVGCAALPLSRSPIVYGVLLAAAGLFSGLQGAGPSAMLSDVVPEERSAVAVSVFRFFGDLGFVVGPLLGGVVASAHGFGPAFVAVSAPMLAVAGWLLATPETRGIRRPGRDEGVGL